MFDQLVLDMYEKEIIKFGRFTLKSGQESYVYVDLRTTISYSEMYVKICELFSEYIRSNALVFNAILGIPYSALTFASAVAYKDHYPMLLSRKEAKAYGTKKQLEGNYQQGDTCLLIEDVVTTGKSTLETMRVLTEHGLQVTDLVCIVDRQGSAQANLQKHGCRLHSMITLSEILSILLKYQKISHEQYTQAMNVMKQYEERT